MSEYLQYGGQAVIEGVMMRGPRFFAVACRRPDGSICVREEPVRSGALARAPFLNKPFVRGALALFDAMALGMRALSFSAQVQTEAEQGSEPSSEAGRKASISDIAIGVTMVIAFAFGMGLFVALPTTLTQLVQGALHINSPFLRNVTDGVLRIAIFMAYISLISLMHNVRRVFQYHGAEHKAINTLEEQRDVTLTEALTSSRIHPRCGTSFIVVVLVVSIIVHSLLPRPENALVRVALHLGLLPVIAGIAYEAIRFAGRRRGASALTVMMAPGLWTQQITTREPSPDQVEVALAALTAVMRMETGAPSAAPAEAAPGG